MKSFLQTMTITLALFLLFAWTNIDLPWYGALFIGLAMAAYGIKNYYEGVRYGRVHTALLDPKQFDEWLRSHGIDPRQAARRSNESN